MAPAQTVERDTIKVFNEEHPLVYEDAWDLWPYVFLNENGEPDGYNIDMLKMIFKELDIPYIIKLKPTLEAQADLKSGKSDLMLRMDASFSRGNSHYSKSIVQLFTHSVVAPQGQPQDATRRRNASICDCCQRCCASIHESGPVVCIDA